ncbi:MAG: SAM-dependent methyltransferase [Bacteroidia bacterium]|jgi:16S rRNA (cytidine1402-2'-O)-methyltransferase|nr:SAM-dependent methyltransferase [Sphingobacteriaceae bacterium]MBK7309599.1 SAM-dependent methyltransferase [Sphingobacteriaceae bacterium]MBK7817880.1 SAM-dependent methyltransferase [Sphingobacteriaceae bacterium]MBP9068558.1 SAM-dependent methyltransferase [Bacteroidia bacterium]
MSLGILYLFPGPLSETEIEIVLPKHNIDLIKTIKHFIAEDAKTARRFLKLCAYPNIQDAEIALLNEHTESNTVGSLLEPLLKGHNVGLMSDAGCPGIADPGAEVVKLAHKKGIRVLPWVGPSSIVLTIMASGFNGQNFAFNGYLPIEKDKRVKRIKELELFAVKHKQAQYFIETPYRNTQLFADLLASLNPSTQLCLGINLTDAAQQVITKSVSEWKNIKAPEIHKIPAVFGIYF